MAKASTKTTSDDEPRPTKIVELRAENFKRLRAVRIRPDGSLVAITGRNGQGKSSVLDAIWAALGGKSHIDPEPVRRGERKAKVELDLGDLVVTRTFTAPEEPGEPYGTALTVAAADGAKYASPQEVINELMGRLAFDPGEFERMKPKDQFNELRAFVPGVDFDQIERENQRDYDRRTFVNREAKQKRAAAEQIDVPASLASTEAKDVPALVDEVSAAMGSNAEVAARKKRLGDLDREAGRIEDELERLTARLADVRREAEALGGESGELIDLEPLRARLQEAREAEAAAGELRRRRQLVDEAKELEDESAALTRAIDERTEAKLEAIAAAKLPVEGLGFGDGYVTLGGVPFQQASDAERLRASIAIAMALNPQLRVIRVREGSRFDSDALRMIADMAAERDFQVWVERVDESGAVGFVIEDGEVAAAKPTGKAVRS